MTLRLFRKGPDRTTPYAHRARLHRAMENWEVAMTDLADVFSKTPTAGLARADRAVVLLLQGNNEAALLNLDRASVTTWFPANGEHVLTPAVYPQEFEQRLVGFFGRALGR
jgi:hypothetical protein